MSGTVTSTLATLVQVMGEEALPIKNPHKNVNQYTTEWHRARHRQWGAAETAVRHPFMHDLMIAKVGGPVTLVTPREGNWL